MRLIALKLTVLWSTGGEKTAVSPLLILPSLLPRTTSI
jgi:hypothetical protein